MREALIDTINQKIFQQFPYLKGTSPEISALADNQYRLTYKGQVKTENNIPLAIIVRVVVNSSGKIIKLTTSR